MKDLNKLLGVDESVIIDNPSLEDERPDEQYDSQELKWGIEVEMEDNHSEDEEIQKSIAKDHLDEDPNYYSKLKEIEPDHF